MFVGAEAGEQLLEALTAFDRALPIAVFAPSISPVVAEDDGPTRDDIVRAAARYNAGLATVAVIDGAAASVLQDGLGRFYAVWGGALRVYMPDLDPAVDAKEAIVHVGYFGPHKHMPNTKT